MVQKVDSEGLRRLVTVELKPALVLFSGEWCGDCAAFAPLWKRWTTRRKEPIFTVEVARGAPEWDDWEIDEIPTVMAFEGGIEKGRAAGIITEKDLEGLATHLRSVGLPRKKF